MSNPDNSVLPIGGDDIARLYPVPWGVDSFPHPVPKFSKATIYAADSTRIGETIGEHAHALAHLIVDSVNRYLPNANIHTPRP